MRRQGMASLSLSIERMTHTFITIRLVIRGPPMKTINQQQLSQNAAAQPGTEYTIYLSENHYSGFLFLFVLILKSFITL